jgi:hypothetical protein
MSFLVTSLEMNIKKKKNPIVNEEYANNPINPLMGQISESRNAIKPAPIPHII